VIDGLDLSHPDLRQLHAVLIDALAHCENAEGFDRDCCMAEIDKSGVSELWERAEGLVRRARQWPALSDASVEDAREALAQALHLHRNARTLHRELRAAEAALASDPSDEHLQHLLAVQAQFHDAQATEALIEGFGVTSGRVDRN
jgi:DNA primase